MLQGGCVLQVNPLEGKLLRRIEVPSRQVTSVAFGGPGLDELYITTARENLTVADLAKPDNMYAGKMFRLSGLGVTGVPAAEFKCDPTWLDPAMAREPVKVPVSTQQFKFVAPLHLSGDA